MGGDPAFDLFTRHWFGRETTLDVAAAEELELTPRFSGLDTFGERLSWRWWFCATGNTPHWSRPLHQIRTFELNFSPTRRADGFHHGVGHEVVAVRQSDEDDCQAIQPDCMRLRDGRPIRPGAARSLDG